MISIKVLYFGELREQVDTVSETVQLPAGSPTVQTLVDILCSRGTPWTEALGSNEPLRIAVNHEMAHLDSPIPDNAEVALFRPVTGG